MNTILIQNDTLKNDNYLVNVFNYKQLKHFAIVKNFIGLKYKTLHYKKYITCVTKIIRNTKSTGFLISSLVKKSQMAFKPKKYTH